MTIIKLDLSQIQFSYQVMPLIFDHSKVYKYFNNNTNKFKDALKRYENGDKWAWCIIYTTAMYNRISAHERRGGYSFLDEDEFLRNSLYDLKCGALHKLNMKINVFKNLLCHRSLEEVIEIYNDVSVLTLHQL